MMRNFSMQSYWDKLAETWEPVLHFKGQTEAEWHAWREEAAPRLVDVLGHWPTRVPLNATSSPPSRTAT